MTFHLTTWTLSQTENYNNHHTLKRWDVCLSNFSLMGGCIETRGCLTLHHLTNKVFIPCHWFRQTSGSFESGQQRFGASVGCWKSLFCIWFPVLGSFWRFSESNQTRSWFPLCWEVIHEYCWRIIWDPGTQNPLWHILGWKNHQIQRILRNQRNLWVVTPVYNWGEVEKNNYQGPHVGIHWTLKFRSSSPFRRWGWREFFHECDTERAVGGRTTIGTWFQTPDGYRWIFHVFADDCTCMAYLKAPIGMEASIWPSSIQESILILSWYMQELSWWSLHHLTLPRADGGNVLIMNLGTYRYWKSWSYDLYFSTLKFHLDDCAKYMRILLMAETLHQLIGVHSTIYMVWCIQGA